MPRTRFSQRELKDLREADVTVRETADRMSCGDIEDGPLRFSQDAYSKLRDVPALVEAVNTANELLRNRGARVAANPDRSLHDLIRFQFRVLRSISLAVCSILLGRLGFTRAADRLDARARALRSA